MTIGEAVGRCDRLKPNGYDREDKIRWLSDLDGAAVREIFSVHEGQSPDFDGYGPETPEETPLLIPAPYEEVYVKYLFAQIDFHNAEFARYNNSAAMFQMAYNAFADAYNRTHRPRQEHRVRI